LGDPSLIASVASTKEDLPMSNSDSNSDPFAAFEGDRTVIKPKARMPSAFDGAAISTSSFMSTRTQETPPIDTAAIQVLNPLVSAASTLLSLLGSLRNVRQAPNISTLRSSLTQAIGQFEATAQRASIANGQVIAARYILCTALDEAVANTPWGVQAQWSQQSLLVQFHNETWGGEKVFQLLAKLSQDVATNRHLLQLLYCVFALGFEGRYRVIDNGRAQLDSIRQRLSDLIRKDLPPPDPQLSPHWRGHKGGTGRVTDGIPLWVMAAGLALLLALIYVAFRFSLNYRSDSTFAAVSSLRVPNVQVVTAAPLPAKNPRLSGFLQPEIKEGLVTVLEESDRTIVRLRGDSFFSSGQAQPNAQSLPTLQRIGQALAQVKGEVQVLGHSDNQPIRSLRFPSNWHLSTARAEEVRNALIAQVSPTRMKAAGKADAEPVAPNDSADNRARNRRVDIVLFPEQSALAVTSAAANTGAKQ
jgi:type VI secretion system protein ImpK